MKNILFSLISKNNYAELENYFVQNKEKVLTFINEKDVDSGYAPLTVAVTSGNMKIVKLLVDNGANVNTQDLLGRTPLHYTCDHNYLEIAKFLIKHGANINLTDNHLNQPLFEAVFNAASEDEDKLPLVELFLKNGADPNFQNKSNKSPLSFAKEVDDNRLVKLLEENAG